MTSAGQDTAFRLLDPKVQRWVYRQKWPDLRQIQKDTITAFFGCQDDLIVAAPTAAGKTEAVFLPVCSAIVQNPRKGIRALCISPLKALINDQHERLELLGQDLDLSVHAWHGDVPQSAKQRLLKRPEGVLFITPESLEALFILRGDRLKRIFAGLEWLIVDELHVFITSERGRQIQAQMHRLEILLGRSIRRLGLSATLGDFSAAKQALRIGGEIRVLHQKGGQKRLMLQFQTTSAIKRDEENEEAPEPLGLSRLLFDKLRSNRQKEAVNHLVFANRRDKVERLAYDLQGLSELRKVPLEFYPHHGNLSKVLRQTLEQRLKQTHLPTTAICTSTLELGIDIGNVFSVTQIGVPPMVASLRQRLGRSGRRDGKPRLRYFYEHIGKVKDASIVDRLYPDLFLSLAMLELLIEGWNEPFDEESLHPSTLVHQILSVIAQYGGASAGDLWRILCKGNAPFNQVPQDLFKLLLRHLGAQELIQQLDNGLLVLGAEGEALVEDYHFYAVFASPEEYRVESRGQDLGRMPLPEGAFDQQTLIFAGRSWRIQEVDTQQKVIHVVAAPGGKSANFQSDGFRMLHTRVAQKIKTIYEGNMSKFLEKDELGQKIFNSAQCLFHELELSKNVCMQEGTQVVLFPWLGGTEAYTLILLFHMMGLNAYGKPPYLVVEDTNEEALKDVAEAILEHEELTAQTLVAFIKNRETMKFDHLVHDDLLDEELALNWIRLPQALSYLRKLV